MEATRQTRARAQLRSRFDADVLRPLRAVDADAAIRPREFVAVQSGNSELECSTSSIASGAHSLVDACTDTFTDLLQSADSLIQLARERLYDSLLLYGEDADHLLGRDGGVIEMVTAFLPHLHDLANFVRQCEQIAGCLLRQLRALFNLGVQGGLQQLTGARDMPMGRVWRSMGDLLSVLIVIDEVIQSHPFLLQHWAQFVRSIGLVQHNPSQFGLHGQLAKLQQLNAQIARLSTELMDGNIFKNCCHRIAASLSALPEDRAFFDRFRRTIMDTLARWERVSAASDTAVPDKQRLLALLALAQLYHSLLMTSSTEAKLKNVDRKMLRALCATHKRVVAFYLVGDILFSPGQHIAKAYATADPEAIDRKTMASVTQARAALLDHQIEQLGAESQTFELLVTEWCHKMDDFGECPPSNGDSTEQITTQKCNLLFEGAHIADRMGRLLKCILNGHLAENRALTKQNARLLFALVQHIKRITGTLNLHWVALLEWTQCACADSASAVLRLLENAARPLVAAGGAKNAQTVAALHNAQLALAQPANKRAIIRCGVALEMANYAKVLRSLDHQHVDDQLGRIDLLWNLGSLLHRVTDLSFLYWHRHSLCEVFCGSLLHETEPNVYAIKHVFDALNDCTHRLLSNAIHCEQQALMGMFSRELFAIVKERFLDKLCTQIENDLRLSYHSQQSATLETLGKQLFGQQEGGAGAKAHLEEPTTSSDHLLHLLHLPRFQLGDQLIDVKGYVTAHLESTFYNLSVIALHDCDSYRRMALLAELRYNLRLADPGLPNMSVDQGLDLLTIMADPDSFMANYCYDLNEQFFIERDGQGKAQLNLVRIQQVVNSVKTHGLGILNTLVNSAYKYLRVQFQHLSRCLFDERVKSLLVQEIRFYRDAIDELDQMYPMSRAEKLANVLRRHENASVVFGGERGDFLEKFRMLITRIGNMFGLLRLIRTGFVEFCSPVILHQRRANLAPATTTMANVDAEDRVAHGCAELRDRALQNAWGHLTDSSDCIEMLTSVFAREFRSNATKYAHLRHFFVVVPALTVSHVEHTMGCRARLQTSGRREAVAIGCPSSSSSMLDGEQLMIFVEDGFSMGVAYVLTLLSQRFFFDSLNWFDSVQRCFRAELTQCARELKEAQKRKDDSLARVLAIKASQLEECRADHQLMACTLNSALTLFHANELLGDEEGEEAFLEDF